MDKITVRFVHRETRAPVMEVDVPAYATVGALRDIVSAQLASEEHCMMRTFIKWHVEMGLAGEDEKKRLVELTDVDEGALLHSLGISHLSEVHLEGPLTGDSLEGVAQAVGILNAQVRSGNVRTNTILKQLQAESQRTDDILKLTSAALKTLTESVRQSQELLAAVVHTQNIHNTVLISLLQNVETSELGNLFGDESAAFRQLLIDFRAEGDKLQVRKALALRRLTIDRTTPHQSFTISEDGTNATKISFCRATFRTYQPLSLDNHRWAVRMEAASAVAVGMLPKLTAAQIRQMEDCYIDQLGGWCLRSDGSLGGMYGGGISSFKEGDLVTFDFSFDAKTLTISCNGKTVVGRIPSIKDGDELYPAVSFYGNGTRACFEAI